MSILDALITDRTQADVNRLKNIMAKGTSMTTEERLYFLKGELEGLQDSVEDGLTDSNNLLIGCRNGRTPKGAYNYTDLNRVYDAVDYLVGRLRFAGYVADNPKKPNKTHVTKRRKRVAIDMMNVVIGSTDGMVGSARSDGTSDYFENYFQQGEMEYRWFRTKRASTYRYSAFRSKKMLCGGDFGHTYYIGCQYMNSSNSSGKFSYLFGYGDEDTSSPGGTNHELEGTGQIMQFSDLYTMPDSAGFWGIAFSLGEFSAGEEHYFRRPFGYDLTAAFGAGNEPSLEWCRENIGFSAENFHMLEVDFEEVEQVSDRYDIPDIPTESEMIDYLQNIRELTETFVLVNLRYDTTPSVPEDMEGLLHEEANDIEKLLLLVADTLDKIEEERSLYFSGDLYGGEI